MSHRAKIVWIPADQRVSVVCLKCGLTLVDDAVGYEFEESGDCEEADTLSVAVAETVGLRDIFGL